MAHLIDKDALVAEINNRLHQLTDAAFDSMIGRNLIEIKDFIDTLEVKEVDFEKEYAKFSNDIDAEYAFPIDLADYKDFAKHFFELGLRTSNPLTWEDIDWIVGEAVCRVTEDSEAEQICKEVLKRFKAQKGE